MEPWGGTLWIPWLLKPSQFYLLPGSCMFTYLWNFRNFSPPSRRECFNLEEIRHTCKGGGLEKAYLGYRILKTTQTSAEQRWEMACKLDEWVWDKGRKQTLKDHSHSSNIVSPDRPALNFILSMLKPKTCKPIFCFVLNFFLYLLRILYMYTMHFDNIRFFISLPQLPMCPTPTAPSQFHVLLLFFPTESNQCCPFILGLWYSLEHR